MAGTLVVIDLANSPRRSVGLNYRRKVNSATFPVSPAGIFV
jgi:hypothetical protein